MTNYIYINNKRTKLNLEKFTQNILDPLLFGLAMAGTFAIAGIGFLIAYGMGGR